MKTKDLIADLAMQTERPDFTPTRAAGLARLGAFADRSGISMAGVATTILDLRIVPMYPLFLRGSGIG